MRVIYHRIGLPAAAWMFEGPKELLLLKLHLKRCLQSAFFNGLSRRRSSSCVSCKLLNPAAVIVGVVVRIGDDGSVKKGKNSVCNRLGRGLVCK